jgi:CBS domain containing-hemolysin-like protein
MRFRDQVMSTFVMIVLGAVLFLGSLLVILAVLRAALTNAQVQGAVALTVILLVLLWWMWLQLPKWLRALFGRFFMRLRGKKGEHR